MSLFEPLEAVAYDFARGAVAAEGVAMRPGRTEMGGGGAEKAEKMFKRKIMKIKIVKNVIKQGR